jgi:hypothetical protein
MAGLHGKGLMLPHLAFCDRTVFRQWDKKVEAFPTERTYDTFTEAVSFDHMGRFNEN